LISDFKSRPLSDEERKTLDELKERNYQVFVEFIMNKGDSQLIKDRFKIVSSQLLRALWAIEGAWGIIDKIQSYA
jgi:two-component SAPR family response regulator